MRIFFYFICLFLLLLFWTFFLSFFLLFISSIIFILHFSLSVSHNIFLLSVSHNISHFPVCHNIFKGKEWDVDTEEFVHYNLSTDASRTLSFSDESLRAALKEKGSLAAIFNVKNGTFIILLFLLISKIRGRNKLFRFSFSTQFSFSIITTFFFLFHQLFIYTVTQLYVN